MDISLEAFALTSLGKLLDDGERAEAGVRKTTAKLTSAALIRYRSTTSLQEKEHFENVVLAAVATGAVSVQWESGYVPKGLRSDGFISRIDLCDINHLALFLNRKLVRDKILHASKQFAPLLEKFPVLSNVISRWAHLKTVRGLKPEDVVDWIDAAKVLDYSASMCLHDQISIPIREASARLFNDSKRIEKLASAVDVLLSKDVDADVRASEEVWNEIGLFREEHPVRLAGNTIIVRDRVTATLDKPYLGLSATSIIQLGSIPKYLMTIENQTTFHSEARRQCDNNVLLIFTSGMPTPAWRAAYCRLLSSLTQGTPVYHWGDVDEGGFRIAALLARDAGSVGHTLLPWRMHPEDIPADLRRPATEGLATKMRRYAEAAGWDSLGEALFEARITIEQEGLEVLTLQ